MVPQLGGTSGGQRNEHTRAASELNSHGVQIYTAKIQMVFFSRIYLIQGLIVLIQDASLKMRRRTTGMFFEKTIKIGIILEVQFPRNLLYRVLSPE